MTPQDACAIALIVLPWIIGGTIGWRLAAYDEHDWLRVS